MTDSPPGYRHVEFVMGTAVSIDVRDDVGAERPGLREVIAWLHHVDETFSTHRPDSPISRLGRGELAFADATDEIRAVLRRCEELRAETDGAFDALAVPAPNGTELDPSGYVKGWSIEAGAGLLESYGLARFCINAGGDIVVRGVPHPDPAWRVGIRLPADVESLAAVLEVAGPMAIATSGTYERGAHIVDPRDGQPTAPLASVTVVGPDLGLADAFATATFVMGDEGLDWLSERPEYEGLVITHDGRPFATPGLDRFLAAAHCL